MSNLRAPVPIVSYTGLIVTLLGLATLLVVPIIAHHASERDRTLIETEIDPARRQINEAMELAHHARSYALSYYFLLSETPHTPYATPAAYYQALVAQWQQLSQDDSHIARSGAEALKYWRSGRADITEWMRQYGAHYISAGDTMSQDRYRAGAGLFERGMSSLYRSRDLVNASAQSVRYRILAVSRAETYTTVAMAIVCLLLAGMAWQNAVYLRRSWERERDSSRRLEIAARETNHRVKNNLQVIGALIDMQQMEWDGTVPKEALEDISRQVKAVAAVHDFLTRGLRGDTVPADQILHHLAELTAEPAGLNVEVSAEPIPLSIKQATALALITNELLLNSGKHGATRARVAMTNGSQEVCLQVRDNGPGFAPDFDPERNSNTGIELVTNLTRGDLHGDVAFRNSDGALIDIRFPRGEDALTSA